MSDRFILEDKVPVPCDDLIKWAKWFGTTENRRVASTDYDNDVNVSTVFLGLDHSYGGGPPLIFETMIFGGDHDSYQDRCSTWEEAEEMHKKACQLIEGTEGE